MVRGLAINRCGATTDGAIYLQAFGSHVIAGNVIGLDPTGHFVPGVLYSQRTGIWSDTPSSLLIGGAIPPTAISSRATSGQSPAEECT